MEEVLTNHFSQAEFPAHIDVMASQSNDYLRVWVTDFDNGINVSGEATPETDHGLDLETAMLKATTCLIAKLRESGNLPRVGRTAGKIIG